MKRFLRPTLFLTPLLTYLLLWSMFAVYRSHSFYGWMDKLFLACLLGALFSWGASAFSRSIIKGLLVWWLPLLLGAWVLQVALIQSFFKMGWVALPLAYDYMADTPNLSVYVGLGLLGICFLLKKHFFLILSLFYAIPLPLMIYYTELFQDPPLAELLSQSNVQHVSYGQSFSKSRHIQANTAKTQLFISFSDDRKWDSSENGIGMYDLEQQRFERIFTGSVGARMLFLDETQELIFATGRRRDQLAFLQTYPPYDLQHLPTLSYSDSLVLVQTELFVQSELDPKIAWVRPYEKQLFHMIELKKTHPFQFWNLSLAYLPDAEGLFFLLLGNNETQLIQVHAHKTVKPVLSMPGYGFTTHYSESLKKLYIPSLTEPQLYEIDPKDMTWEIHPFPNAIRGITSSRGLLIASDLRRGMLYVYDPKAQTMITQLRTFVNAEGLYADEHHIYSAGSNGLLIFELPLFDGP